MNRSASFRVALCSVLIALSLALSFFEKLLLPIIPVAGVRIGLANVVTLFAIYYLTPKHAFIIVLSRTFLSSLFGGGISSFLFSCFGGLLALVVMLLSVRCKALSIYGVSVLGSSAHSFGQIIAASLLFASPSVFAYLPVMLLVSILTGIIIAFVAHFTLPRINMYKK